MQISLKLIQGINYAKSTVCIKFQLLVLYLQLPPVYQSLHEVYCRTFRRRLSSSPHSLTPERRLTEFLPPQKQIEGEQSGGEPLEVVVEEVEHDRRRHSHLHRRS